MKKCKCAAVFAATGMLMCTTAFAEPDLDLKNFMLMPDYASETFEDESVLREGVLAVPFLELSDGAIKSSIETEENGNKYFSLTDDNDEAKAYSVITIKPVGDVANDRCILSFDFCLPIPNDRKANSNDSSAEYLRFYARGRANTEDKDPYLLQFNFTCANPDGANRDRFVFSRFDGGQASAWVGDPSRGGLMEYNKWYTVRYEFNSVNRTYNYYLYDRNTGALLTKNIGNSLKSADSAYNQTSSSDYRLTYFTFQINARNNGAPMSIYFDNIAVAREKFYVSDKPVINVEDDIITASAVVGNQTFDSLTSPVLCLAIYDSSNCLVSASYDCVQAPPKEEGNAKRYGAAELSCSLKRPAIGEGYTARAVVITKPDNAMAYASVSSVELECD